MSKLAGKFLKGELIGKEFLKGELIGKERCLSVSRSGRGTTSLEEAVIECR